MNTHNTKRTYRVRCKSGSWGWRTRLRNNYKDEDEWITWNNHYGLAARLGFKSAHAAWLRNPVIEGSVIPSDFRKVKA